MINQPNMYRITYKNEAGATMFQDVANLAIANEIEDVVNIHPIFIEIAEEALTPSQIAYKVHSDKVAALENALTQAKLELDAIYDDDVPF